MPVTVIYRENQRNPSKSNSTTCIRRFCSHENCTSTNVLRKFSSSAAPAVRNIRLLFLGRVSFEIYKWDECQSGRLPSRSVLRSNVDHFCVAFRRSTGRRRISISISTESCPGVVGGALPSYLIKHRIGSDHLHLLLLLRATYSLDKAAITHPLKP